jgi:hypothetical protein
MRGEWAWKQLHRQYGLGEGAKFGIEAQDTSNRQAW